MYFPLQLKLSTISKKFLILNLLKKSNIREKKRISVVQYFKSHSHANHSDAKKCLLALAKYPSRLFTFYQKRTIDITDLIDKNDGLNYSNNLLSQE